MTVGQRIRTAREAAKMTQEELAAQCGTTKQTIFKYENDIITNIPLSRFEKISRSLDVTPSYLAGWHSDDPILPDSDPFKALFELPDDERQLISVYRALNAHGQDKLLDYASDLAASGNYSSKSELRLLAARGGTNLESADVTDELGKKMIAEDAPDF